MTGIFLEPYFCLVNMNLCLKCIGFTKKDVIKNFVYDRGFDFITDTIVDGIFSFV